MTYDSLVEHDDHVTESYPAQQPTAASSKRQYTIKGIEEETLDLMRTAARHEGMKVGAWVSARLRAAAQSALDAGACKKSHDDVSAIVSYIRKIEEKQEAERERLEEIQSGLAQLIRAQHSMMAGMLGQLPSAGTRWFSGHDD